MNMQAKTAPALAPVPMRWNSRTLASIATDLEQVMGRWNTPDDAYHLLFSALNAIENADFHMNPDPEAGPSSASTSRGTGSTARRSPAPARQSRKDSDMNEQMNLMYHGKQARHTDPETSRQAADSITDVRAVLRRRVEQYAINQGPLGFTDYDMGLALGNQGSGLRTRRNELTKEGIIVPTEQRRTLPSGRKAVVWVHRQHRT